MKILRQKKYSIISRGVRWIKEIKTIEKLPLTLEEYEKFIYPIEIVGDKIHKLMDDPEIIRIFTKVDKYYNSKDQTVSKVLSSVGRCYAESYFPKRSDIYYHRKDNMYWNAIRYSYNRIQHLPKRYISDSIGNGGCGIVFKYSKDKVEKVSFKPFTESEYNFYKYLKSNPISVFPKIYDVEKDQVIMEELITESEKINTYRDYISRYLVKERPNKFAPVSRRPNWKLMTEELGDKHEFCKFIANVEDGLYKIFGKRVLGDLGKNNIGQRKNTGEIVYFDPVGGELAGDAF